MKVHTEIENLPVFNKAVVTIGTFDGVHLGHQKIIAQLTSEAKKIGGESVIITFHPHPRKVIPNVTGPVELINTIDERIELFAAKNIDHLVVVPFTTMFSDMHPKAYVEDFLARRFNPAVVIIGYDHRFGKNRLGNYQLLEDYAGRNYFELREIPAELINDSTVSSTAIRKAVREGDMELANRLLGYEFFFSGEVVRGNQRGRTIGFPTANIVVQEQEKIIPGNGVYVVEVQLPDTNMRLHGMMNIGTRPTVEGRNRSVEVNIFGFDGDIYGKRLRVNVHKRLRSERKFDGLDALKRQLAEDRRLSVEYFKDHLAH